MTNTQLTTITKKLSPIAEKALSLTITDDKTLKQAVTLLSQLNQFNDRIVEEREKVTKPLNEALKAERARWKPTEVQNESAIASIRLKMTQYQTNLINQKKQDEQNITNRLAKGTLTLNTAVKKIENLPSIEKEHATDVGLVQFRETQVLKVTNELLIPREYLVTDEKLVLTALKKGIVVPGAELETIQVPVNYR